jgi:hypothetical protein
LLLHFWGVSGKSDLQIRLLAALAAAGTIPIGNFFARRLVGAAAPFGTLLIAVLPSLVANESELPSFGGPYAITVIEAMACGKPIARIRAETLKTFAR